MRFVQSYPHQCLYSCGKFYLAVFEDFIETVDRISASDWLEKSLPDEPSWRSEDTVRLAPILAAHGVDLLDISSGGNHPLQKIVGGPAYQAHFAEAVKKATKDTLIVGAVGSITDGHIAQRVLDQGQADVVLVGRQFQKNPGTVWSMAEDLGVEIHVAHQISWGFKGRGKGRVKAIAQKL
jgi:2,4-dienoyl-CoA reductase-like NADH-dependent reductase (Old Yellow Enzyme family)